MPALCFVCLGNICRSPIAQAVAEAELRARGLDRDWTVDSCGTGDWHVGKLPDPRTRSLLEREGLALDHRARQVRAADFADFDWLLAMDADNLMVLNGLAPPAARAQCALLVDWDPERADSVPDPYYGGEDGFTDVHRIVTRSVRAFLDRHAG